MSVLGRIRAALNPRERREETLAEFDARLDAMASGALSGSTLSLNLAAVFNALTIRSQYLAMVPLIVYKGLPNGGKARAKDSLQYRILHDCPNPTMTSYSFRQSMETHAIMYGGGFAKIARARPEAGGGATELWMLDGSKVKAELRDGGRSLWWTYPKADGGKEAYPDIDVIHIPGLSLDGIEGIGVVRLAADSFQLSENAESFGRRFFANGLNAGGVFQHPGALSDQAIKHLRETIDERSSPGHAHRPMILEEGMTWNKITFSPEEAQFLKTREFQDVEVARWFNLPLRMLKMADASGLRNVEQIAIEMVQGTMLPRYVAWEQELNRKLFADTGYAAEFLVDGLLRGDAKTRADVSHIMRLDGALSANEWRVRENMNPRDDPGGDEYWSQPNLAAGKSNGQQDEGDSDDQAT